MTHIHSCTVSDAALVAPLFDAYRQFYDQAADLPAALAFVQTRLERQESVILLAQDDVGLPVGFCQLYPTFCSVVAAPIFALYDLYVDPAARGQGVGRQLLAAAYAHAKADGKVRMDLTTAKTNLSAQALYQACGWVKDDVFDAYNQTVV
jgi:ribosomal protein S18 acetylase RimI-like enzyme